MSEQTPTTKYAMLLNALCVMQESPVYAVRKGILEQAEQTRPAFTKAMRKESGQIRLFGSSPTTTYGHHNRSCSSRRNRPMESELMPEQYHRLANMAVINWEQGTFGAHGLALALNAAFRLGQQSVLIDAETLERQRKDAERYRWLRNDALMKLQSGPICVAADKWGNPLTQHPEDDPGLGPALHITLDGKELDAAIDSAIAKERS